MAWRHGRARSQAKNQKGQARRKAWKKARTSGISYTRRGSPSYPATTKPKLLRSGLQRAACGQVVQAELLQKVAEVAGSNLGPTELPEDFVADPELGMLHITNGDLESASGGDGGR